MASPETIKQRQLIWAEYRARRTKQQAFINVNAKLGSILVPQSTIDFWYEQFDAGRKTLFDQGTKQEDITHAIQTLPNGEEKDISESVLLMSEDGSLHNEMITPDGRFAIFIHQDSTDFAKVIFYDLFHGEKKETPIPLKNGRGQIFWAKLIDVEYLLMDFGINLLCFKIDYESWTISLIREIDYLGVDEIDIDLLNERNFVIFEEEEFVTGSLVRDSIVLNPRVHFNFGCLCWTKLVGSHLCGFRLDIDDDEWQYCEIDLTALTEQTFEMPYRVNNHFPDSGRLNDRGYCWVGNRLYAPFKDFRQSIRTFSFDSETRIWTDTGISVFGTIRTIFVNEKHVMTLEVAKSDDSETSIIYRFALKKPDTLKNLAWVVIRRNAVLFNSQLYEKIRSRLPYCQGLRSLFISDYE